MDKIKAKCKGVNKAGQPCGFPPQKGKEWCFQHDPEVSADFKKYALGRGLRKEFELPPVEISSAKDVPPLIAELINLDRGNRLKQGKVMTQQRLYDTYLKATELAHLEKEVQEIKEYIKRQ